MSLLHLNWMNGLIVRCMDMSKWCLHLVLEQFFLDLVQYVFQVLLMFCMCSCYWHNEGGYKLFSHDAAQDKEWKQDMKEQEKSLKEFVKETVVNSESRIMAELKNIEAKGRWW